MVCEQQEVGTRSVGPVKLRYSNTAASRKRRKSEAAKFRMSVERSLFAVAVASVLWLVASSSIDFVRTEFFAPQSVGSSSISVAQGDTLWTIAGTIARPGLSREDVVEDIRELNPQLHGSELLQPGTTLYVPTPNAAGHNEIHLARVMTVSHPSM